MLARRLTTILPAMSLAEALETTRIPRVASLTGARTALVTTRRDRSSLWSSIAMRTGNGSYDFAIRGGYHKNTISRTS
jgi:magnesium chelatase family protein